jgi:hypothetical protein
MVSTVGTLLTVCVSVWGRGGGLVFLIETISEKEIGFGSCGKDE